MTPEQRSRAMKRVRLKNGSLEKVVQKELRIRAIKFDRHKRGLPGSPDIVFQKAQVAVFIDGDFWHGWRLSQWEHKLTPFWRNKIRMNRERDARNIRRLRAQGWIVIRIWGHQIKKDLSACISRILTVLPKNYLSANKCLSFPSR